MTNECGPLVSVIIPSYNATSYIKEAVDSALSQTYKDIEVIVVDDGSTDNTRHILETYDGKIQYVYKENGGPAGARNAGIKQSKGEYIAFLDSDDIWLPEKIELQLGVFVKDQRIGLVSCNNYEIDEKGKILGESKHIHYLSQKALFNDLIIKNVVSGGSNAILKKECFDKVGLFDEHLHGTEDWDMWLRVSRLYDIKFVEKPLVKIKIREGSVSAPSNVEKMLENELKLLGKVFSDEQFKREWLLKRKAYSCRYYKAAIAYKEAKDLQNERRYIMKSLLLYPFDFFYKSHLALIVYALIGNKLFKRLESRC